MGKIAKMNVEKKQTFLGKNLANILYKQTIEITDIIICEIITILGKNLAPKTNFKKQIKKGYAGGIKKFGTGSPSTIRVANISLPAEFSPERFCIISCHSSVKFSSPIKSIATNLNTKNKNIERYMAVVKLFL